MQHSVLQGVVFEAEMTKFCFYDIILTIDMQKSDSLENTSVLVRIPQIFLERNT